MGEQDGPDEYERRFMAGGESLARSKVRIPWYVSLWFVVPWLFVMGGAVSAALRSGSAAALVPAAALGVVIALMLLLHTHLRLTVTSKEVNVKLGLFGPRIPLERVRACVPDEHGMPDWLAWGIKWTGFRQWAYFSPGAQGRGIKLTYVDDRGTERGLFVSCHEPEALARAVLEARAASVLGVRVTTEAEAGVGAEGEEASAAAHAGAAGGGQQRAS